MDYTIVKTLHWATAALSIGGFIIRGYWMLIRSDKLQQRIVRIAPHVIDTVFLLSGITLILILGLNAFAEPWLLVKFAGLIVYIVLGTIAIRRGATMRSRKTAFFAALAVFVYIVGVALSKSPTSWLNVLIV